MKVALQRLLALVMVLSLIPWSQAGVCPMKLQQQRAGGCDASAVPTRHAMHHQAQAAGHDCCPKGKVHKAAKMQCPPVQVTGCASAMSCCSIDPQPVNSTEKQSVPRADVVVGLLDVSVASLPVHAVAVESHQPLPHEDSVFGFKEDLRI